jgi:hypothetical protein
MNLRKTHYYSILLSAFLLLSACVPKNSSQVSLADFEKTATAMEAGTDAAKGLETSLPSEMVTSIPDSTATPTPIPPPSRAHYDLSLSLDYYNHYASVEETIQYPNATGEALDQLVLLAYPAIFPSTFILKGITDVNDGNLNYAVDEKKITVSVGKTLNPGETFTFKVVFDLQLPQREGTLGYTPKELNLANWFPYVVPRINNQWVVHDPWVVNSFMVGEFTAYDSSDFDVKVKYSDGRKNIIIAAPADAVVNGDETTFHLEAARTFAMAFSDEFVLSQKDFNGIQIYSYTFPENQKVGPQVADIVAKSIEVYSKYYGPYPHKSLTVVEADFLHGMEFDGLFFLSYGFYNFYDGTPLNNMTMIAAHETSHQWFFSEVGNDQAMEPWLDEAMATYSEAVFYENVYPDSLSWWWDNRVKFFKPGGVVNSDIYSFQGGYEPYRDAVYLRGAEMLRDIRVAVGDQAFFDFLKDYVNTEKNKIATQKDFFDILAKHTTVDVSSIVAQYFKQ